MPSRNPVPRVASTLVALAFGLAPATAMAAHPSAPDVPALRWAVRSDWLVATAAPFGARGNGSADDTAALQRALDAAADGAREGGPTGRPRTLFLPAGTYRVTGTLTLTGPCVGLRVVGCGRGTRLVWAGARSGRVLHVDGICYSDMEGLTFEGGGQAAVGLYYKSARRFQTEVQHRHLAFRGFTEAGVLNDPARAQALAETSFENCLFEDCGRGAAFLQFNDYDYTFDGCEFRRCGIGIDCDHGNFYARNCRFEGSRQVDIRDGSEHGSSVRRCVSVGSRAFLHRHTSVAPVTVEACLVDGWTDPEGAVRLSRPPALLFDCAFTRGPRSADGRPASPVRAEVAGQRLIASGNRVKGGTLCTSGPAPRTYQVPVIGKAGAPPARTWRALRSFAPAIGRTLDARSDFGARGDGKTDDTAALQRCIDAAARAGGGSLAYLPSGAYAISAPLRVRGRDFAVGGCGWGTRLVWRGGAGGAMVEVGDADRVTLEHMAVGHEGSPWTNGVDILHRGTGRPAHVTYDGIYVAGMYQKRPFEKGLLFEDLGPNDTVLMRHVQGNLRFRRSAAATVLANCTYEGSVTVEGKGGERTGMLGFMTRLATLVPYGVYLRDSHSIVMSDYYVEQSEHGWSFEGHDGDPRGRATISGAKIDFTPIPADPEANITMVVDGYPGDVFFGPDQFYTRPVEKRIRHTGTAPFNLYLLGCSWYSSRLDARLGPGARLHVVGCDVFGDQAPSYAAPDVISDGTLAALGRALDDYRRLGAVDRRLNHGR